MHQLYRSSLRSFEAFDSLSVFGPNTPPLKEPPMSYLRPGREGFGHKSFDVWFVWHACKGSITIKLGHQGFVFLASGQGIQKKSAQGLMGLLLLM